MRILATSAALLAAAALGSGAAQAHGPRGEGKAVTLTADLTQLNGSGSSGSATATVRNQTIEHIEVHASGLTPDAPHAQHIHFGQQALHECPTLAMDTDGDGRLNTVEGIPAYGPIVVSLTTTGDTSPTSGLAVSRFPVSAEGSYHYSRDNIRITKVAGTGGSHGPDGSSTSKEIADAIRAGQGVVVIHGIDYNGSLAYDFGAGTSELSSTLPQEATAPAACGVLR